MQPRVWRIKVTYALAQLDTREVDAGFWLVSFVHYDLD